MHSLPQRVIAKVERLAKRTGKTPAKIVEEAIKLYERELRRREAATADRLDEIARDPKKGPVYLEIFSAMSKRAKAKMSPEERAAVAQSGGIARAAKLTPAQRSAQARKAATARWKP